MTDLTTLKTRLAQAEDAYHQLQMGAQEQEMMLNGRKVVYTPANFDKLKVYIMQLKNEIATTEGVKRRHPLYLSPR
jgi:hypothetical protein